MRAYYFVNFYLSSIQQGIQSMHTTAEMFMKYGPEEAEAGILAEWAADHKTVIVKNGGDSTAILDINQLMQSDANPYPWGNFVEEGIGHDMTCIGIILPEKVYETADELRTMPFSKRLKFLNDQRLSPFDVKIVELIVGTSLAK